MVTWCVIGRRYGWHVVSTIKTWKIYLWKLARLSHVKYCTPLTFSNEKDVPNVTINKNVTPQNTSNTDIPSISTTTTEPSSHSATPSSLEKPSQPDEDFTFSETYFGKQISFLVKAKHSFQWHWFKEFPWLDYDISKDCCNVNDKTKNRTCLLNGGRRMGILESGYKTGRKQHRNSNSNFKLS